MAQKNEILVLPQLRHGVARIVNNSPKRIAGVARGMGGKGGLFDHRCRAKFQQISVAEIPWQAPEVKRLRLEGIGPTAIAKLLGISRASVYRALA